MIGLMQQCGVRGVGIAVDIVEGCSLIQAARNLMLARFLVDTESTHMLMVDDDIGFDPEDVFRMIDLDLPFVAGAVPMRQTGPVKFNTWIFEEGRPITNGVAEIAMAGTAFLLVRRDAIEKMVNECKAEHYMHDKYAVFDLFAPSIDRQSNLLRGEDTAFCHRWRSIGGKIHLLTDCEFTHTGPLTIRGKFSDGLRTA